MAHEITRADERSFCVTAVGDGKFGEGGEHRGDDDAPDAGLMDPSKRDTRTGESDDDPIIGRTVGISVFAVSRP